MNLLKPLSKIALLLSLFIGAHTYAEIAVIVSTSNGNATLDKDSIERIFLGKTAAFPDGSSATPVDQKEGSASREEFNDKVLGKTASQLKAYWSRLIFTGKGTPPKEVGTDADVKALVASNPNMVGYINAALVDGSVKVVAKF